MASIPGIVITSKISPGNTDSTFPTHEDIYGKGGLMSVTTLTDLATGIPFDRQKVGMMIYVGDTSQYYTVSSLSFPLTSVTPSDLTQKQYTHANFLTIAGGTITGSLSVDNDVTIYGNLTAKGTTTFTNTIFTTTSSLCVIHVGNNEPALWVSNDGQGDLASFYDIDSGVEMLHIGGADGTYPNVGIKTSTPDKALTVSGDISAKDLIYDAVGNSGNWNSVYASVCAISAAWEESEEIIPTVTNYLSTNRVLLSSLSIAGIANVGSITLTGASDPNADGTYYITNTHGIQLGGGRSSKGTVIYAKNPNNVAASYIIAQPNSVQFWEIMDLTKVIYVNFDHLPYIGTWYEYGDTLPPGPTLLSCSSGVSISHDTVIVGSLTAYGDITTRGGDSTGWSSTFNTVCSLSANWDSTYTTVYNLSTVWDDAGISEVSPLWDSTYTTVLNTSANWSSVYSSVCSISANVEQTLNEKVYRLTFNTTPQQFYNSPNNSIWVADGKQQTYSVLTQGVALVGTRIIVGGNGNTGVKIVAPGSPDRESVPIKQGVTAEVSYNGGSSINATTSIPNHSYIQYTGSTTLPDATISVRGLMSNTDKTKLDGISSNAVNLNTVTNYLSTNNVQLSGIVISAAGLTGRDTDWISTFKSVCALSANWDSTRTSVFNTSANWDSVYTTVSTLSTLWDEGVSVLSPNWDSTYTTVYNTSAIWDSTYVTVSTLSASWDEGVGASSPNWNSTHTTVYNTSANWSSVYKSVCALSAAWEGGDYWNFRGGFETLLDGLTAMRVTGTLSIDGDTVVFPDLFYNGELNGKPSFKTGDKILYWQTAANAWCLNFYDYDLYTGAWAAAVNVTSPELATGWAPTELGSTGTPVITKITSGIFSIGDVVIYDDITWYCYAPYTFDTGAPQYPEIGSSYWQPFAAGPTKTLPTVTNYLSTNNVILSSATIQDSFVVPVKVTNLSENRTFTDSDNSKVFHFDTTTDSLTATFPPTLSDGFNVALMNVGTKMLRLSATQLFAVGEAINIKYGAAFVYKDNNQIFAVGRL